MTSAAEHPTPTCDGGHAVVSPELSIPPLPGAMASLRDEAPLLLSPLPFVEQARLGRNAWWRYVLAVALLVALVVGSGIAVYVLTPVVLSAVDGERSVDAARALMHRSGLLIFGVLMLVSALELPILFLVVRLFHRRSWRTLIVGPAGFDWSAFCHSLGLLLAIGCFVFFVELTLWPNQVRFDYDAGRFWPFLTLVIVFVPLQTLAEEAIFRGYVLQAVARATGLFAVRLVVPALLFAAAHVDNAPATQGGLWAVLDYTIVAIYLTFLALRGDGLEQAWGFHLGNNLLATVLVTWRGGDFDVPSLFVLDHIDYVEGFIFSTLTCALHFALLLRFSPPRLARRAAAFVAAPVLETAHS